MTNEKKTKWEIGSAIAAGRKTHALAISYRSYLEPRLHPGELEQLDTNTSELESRRSGQSEHLVDQKSKTIGQDELVDMVRDTVISLRNVVRSNCEATPDILKAYGVGEKITFSISSVKASGNIVITAYNTYTEWSNRAGIIESDITFVSNLLSQLNVAEGLQGKAMFARKSSTMSKNVLQRAVEDEVSKISALGHYIFLSRDAAVAKLFEDLIPAAAKVNNGEDAEANNPTEQTATT